MNLREWLEKCGMQNIRPMTLTLGGQTYTAASYNDPRFDGDERVYAIGGLPKDYLRSSKVCFRMPQDERDWYVAGYYPAVHQRQQAPAEHGEYTPFGAFFLLSPWPSRFGGIDDGERKPYRRLPAQTLLA